MKTMHAETQTEPESRIAFPPLPRVARLLILAVLFITAFLIRCYKIDEPLMYFHSVRQYRSAIIARCYYF
jgi:hypothetical protein